MSPRPAPGPSASIGPRHELALRTADRLALHAGRPGRPAQRASSPSSRASRCSASRLGVAALIIVLSIMNGFQKEVRNRMLSLVSHVEVVDAGGAALADWRPTAAAARRNPAGRRRRALRRLAGPDRARRRHARRDRPRHRPRRGGDGHRPRRAAEGHDADAPRSRRLGRRPRRRAGARARRARGRQGHASSCPAARSRRPAWCRG